MKGFMKKGAVIIVAGMLLTGCGEELTTLTESEEAVIVNYSAGTLAKFNKRQQDGMTAVALKEETETDEMTVSEENEQTDEQEKQESQDKQDADTVDAQEGEAEVSLNQALGLTGVEIKYTGYEISSSYEESDYFSMAATEGKTYFVMKFNLTNAGSEEMMCDILNQKPIFTLSLNGTSARKNEVTLLQNDLSTYSASLAPGAVTEAVLIFEVPVGETTEITSVQADVQVNGITVNVIM